MHHTFLRHQYIFEGELGMGKRERRGRRGGRGERERRSDGERDEKEGQTDRERVPPHPRKRERPRGRVGGVRRYRASDRNGRRGRRCCARDLGHKFTNSLRSYKTKALQVSTC
jgi:hypothetical protein